MCAYRDSHFLNAFIFSLDVLLLWLMIGQRWWCYCVLCWILSIHLIDSCIISLYIVRYCNREIWLQVFNSLLDFYLLFAFFCIIGRYWYHDIRTGQRWWCYCVSWWILSIHLIGYPIISQYIVRYINRE